MKQHNKQYTKQYTKQHTQQYNKQCTKQHTNKTITNSTCIVTGGAGFIGSHIVDALATPTSALQNHIIIIDNLSTGKLANIAHHFNNTNREAFEQASLEQVALEQWHEQWHTSNNSDSGEKKESNNSAEDSVRIRITDKQQSLDSAQANKSKNKEEQKEEFVLPGNHVTFIKADITDLALLQSILLKTLYFNSVVCYLLLGIVREGKAIILPFQVNNI